VVDNGKHVDIIVIDEYYGVEKMRGSEAINQLRAASPEGREIIVSCSGNASVENASSVTVVGADAVWGKPFPDWRDGTMQHQLRDLFSKRRRAAESASM
jgi:CheY-like chemotaxis protein